MDATGRPPLGVGLVTVVVADYDEAVAFWTGPMGFELIGDTDLGDGKRWVVVAPAGGSGAGLLLARAVGDRQQARVGDQTGGRVGFFLYTRDLAADQRRMLAGGVRFLAEPRREPYGTVAVFRDVSGNAWDLIEPTS